MNRHEYPCDRSFFDRHMLGACCFHVLNRPSGGLCVGDEIRLVCGPGSWSVLPVMGVEYRDGVESAIHVARPVELHDLGRRG